MGPMKRRWRLLRSEHSKVRRVAIYGLAAHSVRAKEIVPGLRQAAFNDPDDDVRRDAAAILRQIDPEAAPKAGLLDPP